MSENISLINMTFKLLKMDNFHFLDMNTGVIFRIYHTLIMELHKESKYYHKVIHFHIPFWQIFLEGCSLMIQMACLRILVPDKSQPQTKSTTRPTTSNKMMIYPYEWHHPIYHWEKIKHFCRVVTRATPTSQATCTQTSAA